jgi:hypothetical protein
MLLVILVRRHELFPPQRASRSTAYPSGILMVPPLVKPQETIPKLSFVPAVSLKTPSAQEVMARTTFWSCATLGLLLDSLFPQILELSVRLRPHEFTTLWEVSTFYGTVLGKRKSLVRVYPLLGSIDS